MRMKIVIIGFLTATLMAPCGEIGGVTLPDTMTLAGTDLALNGAGLRKKLFIKVYAGGLYIKSKSKDATAIVAADEPMAIRMHFIYDGVSAEKLTGAWNDGFKAALGENQAAMQEKIDAFNALFTTDAKEDDVYDISYVPGSGTSVVINGNTVGTVESHEFKKAVFSIWLGKKVADGNLAALKKSMLGK